MKIQKWERISYEVRETYEQTNLNTGKVFPAYCMLCEDQGGKSNDDSRSEKREGKRLSHGNMWGTKIFETLYSVYCVVYRTRLTIK